jgi:hypothetical protein
MAGSILLDDIDFILSAYLKSPRKITMDEINIGHIYDNAYKETMVFAID